MYSDILLKKIGCEIEKCIEAEATSGSKETDYELQKVLHLLFENYKHLKCWIAEKGGLQIEGSTMTPTSKNPY